VTKPCPLCLYRGHREFDQPLRYQVDPSRMSSGTAFLSDLRRLARAYLDCLPTVIGVILLAVDGLILNCAPPLLVRRRAKIAVRVHRDASTSGPASARPVVDPWRLVPHRSR
jgi:hypothetical protein